MDVGKLNERDVQMMMEFTKASRDRVVTALLNNDGDIVRAVIDITDAVKVRVAGGQAAQ